MLPILFSIALWVIPVLGWGHLGLKFLLSSKAKRDFQSTYEDGGFLFFFHLVVGIFLQSFVAIVWNFIWPVYPVLPWIVFLAGTAAFFVIRSSENALSKKELVALAVVLVLVAFGAQHGFIGGDTGLYHFQAVKWAREQPLVQGIGHLHNRLGKNTIWFIFASSLELSPLLQGKGAMFANGVLAFGFAAFLSLQILSKKFFKKENVSHLFLLLSSFLFIRLLGYGSAGEPDYDFPIDLITLAVFWLLLKISDSKQGGERFYFSAAFILATIAVMIKSTALPLAVTVYALALIRRHFKTLLPTALLLFFFSCVWMLRGFFQTGCLIYPTALTCFDRFDFSLPLQEINDYVKLMLAWCRIPNSDPLQTLGNFRWIGPWMKAGLRSMEAIQLLFLLFIAVIGLSYSLLTKKISFKSLWEKGSFTFCLGLFSFLFWFLSFPSLRLARGYLFGSVLLILCFWIASQPKLHGLFNSRILQKIAFVLMLALFLVRKVDTFYVLWPSIPKVSLIHETTYSGDKVWRPSTDSSCWDAPLPCTPYFDPTLKIVLDQRGYFSKMTRVK